MPIANHPTTADHPSAVEHATDSDNLTIADVYAGDIAPTGAVGGPRSAVHLFKIEAEAGPGTFARVANVLGIANVAPSRVILNLDNTTRTLHIEVELGIGPAMADSLRRKLSQLTDMIKVDVATLS
jgi:hypothetical protein